MNRTSLLSMVCVAVLSAPMAFAQQAPPVPAGGGGGGADGNGRGMKMMRDRMDRGERGEHGMGILPPGMWWKNPDTVTRLGLSAEQQRRMDEIFRQSRIQLVDLKASLEKEQINLEPMLNANPLDQGRTLGEISRIADLRADLEKANAKMLLGLRAVLTAEQWTKMQDHRRGEGMMMRRQEGPDGMRGMRGPGGPDGMGGMPGNPPAPPPTLD